MPDFFFATSKFGYYLLRVPKKLRYFLSIASLAFIALLWFFLVYNPLHKKLNYLIQALNQLHVLQHSQEKIVLENNQIQEIINKKQKKFLNKQKTYKNAKSINEIIMIIFDVASKAGLTVGLHMPQETIDNNWYCINSCKTEFQGTFDSIMQFLESFKIVSPSIHIKKIQIHKIDDEFLNLICEFNSIQIKENHHENTTNSKV